MWQKCNKYILIGAVLLLATTIVAAADDDAVNAMKPRQCFSCEGINCLRSSKTNMVVECPDLLDICVTVFDGFTVAARGCYTNLPTEYRAKCEAAEHPECVKCFGQMCNNKGRADFRCIECNSSNDPKCASDTAAMTPAQCLVPTALNSYCFVRSSTANGAVTRGCFVHPKDQTDCLSDVNCSMCSAQDGEACNSYKLQESVVNGGRVAELGWSSLLAAVLVSVAQTLRIR